MMNSNLSKYYPCERIIDTKCNSEVDHWIQYRMLAENSDNGEIVPYLLDFMRTGRLWITDIYPEMWANDSNKCHKFTSHEGIHINFQRISNTSVYVFLRDFVNTEEVMVISGSYQDNETQSFDSRKLKLYRYFFNKLKDDLQFEIIEAPGLNGFFICHPGVSMDFSSLFNEYKTFKEKK